MKSKKVFVVKHFKSPYIEEAIFILREGATSETALPDAVSEAEKIIDGYLAGLDVPVPRKKRMRVGLLSLVAGLLALTGVLIFLL